MPSLIEKLKEASKDLLYMSESDYPLEPFVWKREENLPDETKKKDKTTGQANKENAVGNILPTADDVLKNSKGEPETKIEEISPEKFFHRATKIEDWYEDEERESAQKFSELRKLFESNLKNIKVFRVGEIEIDIYVVGVDTDGNFVGLKTTVVET